MYFNLEYLTVNRINLCFIYGCDLLKEMLNFHVSHLGGGSEISWKSGTYGRHAASPVHSEK